MATKTIQGQLRDIRNGHMASHIAVTVEKTSSALASGHPEYRMSGIVNGYAPELAGNSYILTLGETIAGEVSLAIHGIPTAEQTRFDIYLQGPEWNDVEWFDSLSTGSDHFPG